MTAERVPRKIGYSDRSGSDDCGLRRPKDEEEERCARISITHTLQTKFVGKARTTRPHRTASASTRIYTACL